MSPRVLPNGTQAISILYRFVCLYDCLGTIVWQKGSLSPRVLPNGTQAISILCRFVCLYDCLGTIVWQKGSLSPRVLPNGTQGVSILYRFVYLYDCLGTIVWQKGSLSPWVLPNGTQAISILQRHLKKNFSIFFLQGRNVILSSLCPQVYGLYVVKLAVAMVLAGGVAHSHQSGTRTRGESHLLLVGDPGEPRVCLIFYLMIYFHHNYLGS